MLKSLEIKDDDVWTTLIEIISFIKQLYWISENKVNTEH